MIASEILTVLEFAAVFFPCLAIFVFELRRLSRERHVTDDTSDPGNT